MWSYQTISGRFVGGKDTMELLLSFAAKRSCTVDS